MSNTIDLDAKRAARRAKRGEGNTLRVDGKDFRLIPELPLAALDLLDANDLKGFLSTIVEPDDREAFAALDLTMDDFMDITGTYLEQLGESAASIGSSLNIGGLSRRISPATTSSTSPNASGANDLHDRLGSQT